MLEAIILQAKVLYDAVRASDGFYDSPVEEGSRSCMNVPFTIPSSADLEKEFLSQSQKAGFVRRSCLCALSCAQAACHLCPCCICFCIARLAVLRARACFRKSLLTEVSVAEHVERAPVGGWHAGFHLQCHARGWRCSSGRFHEGLPFSKYMTCVGHEGVAMTCTRSVDGFCCPAGSTGHGDSALCKVDALTEDMQA